MKIRLSLILAPLLMQEIYAQTCPPEGETFNKVDKGQTCNLSGEKTVTNGTLTNEGTIIFNNGSKLTFNGTSSPPTESKITISSGNNRGTIQVNGSSTIDATGTPKTNGKLTIEGQDINIDNTSFTLKAQEITLGGDSNKPTTITGKGSSSTLVLDTTTTLNTKDASLKNLSVTANSLTTWTNTKTSLENVKITTGTSANITVNGDTNSTFTLKGYNDFDATNHNISITGDHSFEGGGSLIFTGADITLGGNNATMTSSISTPVKLTFKADSTDKTSVGFAGSAKVLFKEVEVTGNLKVQIIKDGDKGATLHNINSTFKGGTLEALQRKPDNTNKTELQTLVIENGNTAQKKNFRTMQGENGIPIGKITISGENGNNTTTFLGKGIEVYGQEISINGSGNSTLILQTQKDEGSITLGKENTKQPSTESNQAYSLQSEPQAQENKDGEVTIKGSDKNKNKLQLNANTTIFGGNVSLEKLSITTQSAGEGMVFQGENGATLTLANLSLTAQKTLKDNKTQYQVLVFKNKNEGGRSNIKIQNSTAGTNLMRNNEESVTLKASSFSFANQDISLTNGVGTNRLGAGTGVSLGLYAYDSKIPTFTFKDTTIKDGSTAKINLYGTGTLVLNPIGDEGLTLENITLTAKTLPSNETSIASTPTQTDLELTEGLIKALGDKNTINAKKFIYGNQQGVASNITVGDSTKTGSLTLMSETGGTDFVLGGLLTLDNSSVNGKKKQPPENTTSTFEVKLGNNQQGQISTMQTELNQIDLSIEKGITAIGNANSEAMKLGNGEVTTTEVKAKSLTFSPDSTLTSINGTLKLTVSESSKNLPKEKQNGEPTIDVRGKTVLIGSSAKEASIQAAKQNNGENGATLQLHDIDVQGKGKLEGKLSFVNSNIFIGGGKENNFEIKNTDNGSSNGKVSNIHSVTLKDATLDIKNGSDTTQGVLEFNKDSYILSSGKSEVKAKSITSTGSNLTLKVTDGTLTLTQTNNMSGLETSAPLGIGDIFLGVKDAPTQSAHLIFDKNGASKTPQTLSYDELKIKGNITTFGITSITADKFTLESGDHTISVNGTKDKGGELKLISQASSGAETLTLTSGAIELNNGSLSYYTNTSQSQQRLQQETEPKLGKITLGSAQNSQPLTPSTAPSITSTGNSSIKAQELTLNGNTITAKEGTLELIGVKDTSTTGNITVGNKGLLVFGEKAKEEEKMRLGARANEEKLVALSLKEGSTITLSADVPYTTSASPLGGGAFGSIQAKSVTFNLDSSSTSKLVHIVVNPETKLEGEALFNLREGETLLIDTTDGIKKTTPKASQASQQDTQNNQTNITLDDITTDTGGYRSLTLTPILVEGDAPKATQTTQTTADQNKIITQLKLGISVKQTTSQEIAEGITDKDKQKEIQDILGKGDNAWIVDSLIQGGDNPLKPGITENIAAGNTAVVRDAVAYINDAYNSLSLMLQSSSRIQEQIKMLQSSNIQNRITRIGNPFASEAELASLLKEASKYRYASSDFSLNDFVETLSAGIIWATYDGGVSGGGTQSTGLNGLSAGYDQIISDQYLVGGILSYGYGSYDGNYLHSRSHNLSLSAYTRMLFDEHEVDISLIQTFGFYDTRLTLGQSIVPLLLNGEIEHNFYNTDLMARYGYTFKVGEEEDPYFLRPFFGFGMEFNYNSGGQTNAQSPMMIESTYRFDLNTQLGLEVRKYFNPHTYVYLMPFFDAKALKVGNDAEVKFVSIQDFKPTQPNTQSDIGVGVYVGGQGSVSENLSVTGNLGLKMDVKSIEVMSTWNLGLKYKF